MPRAPSSAPPVSAPQNPYFEQQDVFRRWLDERCDTSDKKRSCAPGLLLADFNTWAKANGEDALTNNTFAEMVDRTQGLNRTKSNGVRVVFGVMLLPSGRSASPSSSEGNEHG